MLLPRRVLPGIAKRFFHGRTGDRIAAVVGQLPNVSATVIPYQLRRRFRLPWEQEFAPTTPGAPETRESAGSESDELFPEGTPPGAAPIGSVRVRQRAKVAGRIRSVRVQPGAGISSLECTLADATGQLTLVFQGRRLVPGIQPGAKLLAEGMVGERNHRLAMINPHYTILVAASDGEEPSG